MKPVEVPLPGLLRPDLPGLVHGVVGRDPWEIQCDGCGRVDTCNPVISDIRFHAHRFGDERRMCKPCWIADGWEWDGHYGIRGRRDS